MSVSPGGGQELFPASVEATVADSDSGSSTGKDPNTVQGAAGAKICKDGHSSVGAEAAAKAKSGTSSDGVENMKCYSSQEVWPRVKPLVLFLHQGSVADILHFGMSLIL